MKVWIEVELHSNKRSYSDIASHLWLSFNSFNEEWIKMSEEYYRSTIEFNFMPIGLDKKEFDRIADYLKEKREYFNLKLNWDRPQFTWTHLHLFETSSFRKNRLLKWVLSFIKDNFDGLSWGSKERLLLAHQLWGFYDHNQLSGEWANLVRVNWFNLTNYSLCYAKPKYSPVIKSLAIEGWKPLSTEIRCIPNEYIFNGKAYELCKEIENGELYKRKPLEAKDFFKFLIEDLRWQAVITPSIFPNSWVNLLRIMEVRWLVEQHWCEAVYGYSRVCEWWTLREVCRNFGTFRGEVKRFRLINQRIIFENIKLLLNVFTEKSFIELEFTKIRNYVHRFDNDAFSGVNSSQELDYCSTRLPWFSAEIIIDFITNINNEEKVIIITNLLISLEWGIDWDDVDKLTTYREGLLTEQWEVSDNVAAPLSSRALEDAITEMRNTRVNPIREGSLLEPTDFMASYINNLNNDE